MLLHGVETDWVEEEMMEDDVDFIRDVLEQKVIKVLQKAGINKKVFEKSFCNSKFNSTKKTRFIDKFVQNYIFTVHENART